MRVDRVFLVVLDGVGIGALPDAGGYGDAGSNTLVNTARAVGGLSVPHLAAWGLAQLAEIPGLDRSNTAPIGAFGMLGELSPGKDTTTGHWELAGLIMDQPFPVYPHGFPSSIIDVFTAAIGRGILGNKRSSGTEIIQELGSQHLATGFPIIYTSADSVFQIAAHEEIVPREQLYEWCMTARKILAGKHAVARVIARPFVGQAGSFTRTAGRRDFSLVPPAPTILDALQDAGRSVIGIGKIEDIFAGRGLTASDHTTNNEETLHSLHRIAADDFTGLVFANCIDFDMKFGHRNDPQGFAAALTAADHGLGALGEKLRLHDLLFITGDHGCDPTTPSTDHSREYVPLLIAGPAVRPVNIGIRRTFADVAATIAELFALPPWPCGSSFAGSL